MDVSSIYNYKLLTDNIATSGQPTEDELTFIADAGYQVVINLGLDNTDCAVSNEAAFFKNQGISYIHLPVIFEAPKEEDLFVFIKTLSAYKDSKVFIHCAANKRVSAFIALYRILSLGWPVDDAIKALNMMWQPDAIWQAFINNQLSKHSPSQ